MSTSSRAVELLAPAGSWDCLRAAVANGADAVYFGEVSLSGAVRAASMMTARLKEASKLGFGRAFLPESGEVDIQGMKLSLSRIAHLKSLAEATTPCD